MKRISQKRNQELFERGLKKCSLCHKIKPLIEFPNDKSSIHGKYSRCSECNRKHVNRFMKSHPEIRKQQTKRFNKTNPIARMASATLSRHKSSGIDVQITTQELQTKMKETVVCPLCGGKLNYSLYTDKTRRTTPSVDRINNESIMTVDNTWIICYGCNATKGDMTMNEFKQYIKDINERIDKL